MKKAMKQFEEILIVAVLLVATLSGIIGYEIGEKLTIERAKVVSVDSIGCEIEYDNGQIHRYNI